jgi:hypothetical protein
VMLSLHEDLRADFNEQIEKLKELWNKVYLNLECIKKKLPISEAAYEI